MMRIGITVILSGLLMAAGLQGCDNRADQGPAWLVGEWKVSYNPLNDDSDTLKFMPENKVMILTEDGRTLTGHYLIREDHLLLLIEKGSRSIETEFLVSAARDRLTYKNGAYYTRAGAPDTPDTAGTVNDAGKL